MVLFHERELLQRLLLYCVKLLELNRTVDSGLIPSRVKPMTLKLVFTASLLDVQH